MPTLPTNQSSPDANVERLGGVGAGRAEGVFSRGSFLAKDKRGLKDLQKMPSVKI